MIILINGSFGVGKTTVARLLRQRIAGSRIYDPEWVGSILMRLPSIIQLRGRGTDDFQDIALWRRSVVRGIGLTRSFTRATVIVPMAFSDRGYLDEVLDGIRRGGAATMIFCLTASEATIRKRLQQRGENFSRRSGDWAIRKARVCIEAHHDPHFSEPIDTEVMDAEEVANEIIRRLATGKA